MRITPQLIPPEEFHTGSWLLGVERPMWYYFLKEESRRSEKPIANKNFMESVDKPLRELVRFLHERNIGTTPSCSGHHLGERDLGAIHDALVKDRDAIRNGGLELVDIETGRHLLYQDRDHQLPWNADDFIERMMDYQQLGVLGIRLDGHATIRSRILQLRIGGVRIEERDGILFFFTKEADEKGIGTVWRRITQAVKEIFGPEHTFLAVAPFAIPHRPRPRS